MIATFAIPYRTGPSHRELYRRLLRVPSQWLVAGTLLPTVILALSGSLNYGTVAVTLTLTILATASLLDLAFRRIPNWLTGGILLQAFASAAYFGMLPQALAGFALAFAIMLTFYVSFGGGEGDVKMIAVLGAVLGPWLIIDAIALSYIAAMLFSVAAIGLAKVRLTHAVSFRTLPMAPFIALGTLAALRGVLS